jgi:vesicle-fusing ATPase
MLNKGMHLFGTYGMNLFRVFIGIKKLLALIDTARQMEEHNRVVKFLSKLEEEGGLDMGTSIH